MRILIPILLVLAAGVGAFLLLGRDRGAAPGGTGPAASTAAPEAGRPALDLARSADAATGRASAAAPEMAPGAAAAGATEAAAPSPLVPAVPEPSLQGGSTDAPVGITATNPLDEEFALKYLNASRAERVQALQALRTTLENQITSPDKGVQASLESLKHEMGWLESNLDG